jgi:hypothetical protein
MVTSTYTLHTYKLLILIPPDPEQIQPTPKFKENVSWLGFVLALLLMIGANLWKALQIMVY